jgi:hypothetical protein
MLIVNLSVSFELVFPHTALLYHNCEISHPHFQVNFTMLGPIFGAPSGLQYVCQCPKSVSILMEQQKGN